MSVAYIMLYNSVGGVRGVLPVFQSCPWSMTRQLIIDN